MDELRKVSLSDLPRHAMFADELSQGALKPLGGICLFQLLHRAIH